MNVIQYDPSKGCACQGDVMILPMPAAIKISEADEIPMRNGMLVLAEGEVSGHHHAIRYGLAAASSFHDGALAQSIEAKAAVGTARLFRDPASLAALVRKGVLTTDTLCIGFLRVDGDCPPLTHDEHAPIQIPPGDYYIGAKREMDVAAERRVVD